MDAPITREQAEQRGLRPLTKPIPESENWIVTNILRDMRRGGIEAAVVAVTGGVEVWRDAMGFRETAKDRGTSKI